MCVCTPDAYSVIHRRSEYTPDVISRLENNASSLEKLFLSTEVHGNMCKRRIIVEIIWGENLNV